MNSCRLVSTFTFSISSDATSVSTFHLQSISQDPSENVIARMTRRLCMQEKFMVNYETELQNWWKLETWQALHISWQHSWQSLFFKMLIVIVQNRKGLKYINYILFFIIQEFSVLFGATGNGCKRQQGLKRQEISLMSENQCESNCSSSLVFHIGMIGLGLKHSSHINSFDKVSYDKLFFWLLIISVQNALSFNLNCLRNLFSLFCLLLRFVFFVINLWFNLLYCCQLDIVQHIVNIYMYVTCLLAEWIY